MIETANNIESYLQIQADACDALAGILERRVLGAYRPDLARDSEERRETYLAMAEEILGGLYEMGWILARRPPQVNRDMPQEAD